eukprot:scaffold112462_cov46-Attheya_sp.AAC.2
MCNCFWRLPITLSSNTQLFLLRRPNFITRFLLTIFYSVEVLIYSLVGAKSFLRIRRDFFGPNFCALGKVLVGDHEAAVALLDQPQKRGIFLGRARMVASRLPEKMLLFLSDPGATNPKDETHQTLHDFLWDSFIPPAMERTAQPVFQAYVDELISDLQKNGLPPSKNDARNAVEPFIVKYMMHALFDVELTEAQLKDIRTLFFSANPMRDYIAAAVKPLRLSSCCSPFITRTYEMTLDLVENSPALADYEPSEANVFVGKREYADIIMTIAGIAAFGGTANQCVNILTEIPDEYPIDVDNKVEVFKAALEATRRRSPVNNVNVIMQEATEIDINGRKVEFPVGTVVAACICLASLDEKVFPNPDTFNPKRENLESANLNFNMTGFNTTENGRRNCPGRNIAMKVACDVLVAYRKATTA